MDANVAVTQFCAAGVAVWALQQLKSWKKFPILQEDTQRWIKRVYSVAIAIGIHTGISHVWNPGTAAGAGTLILVFPGWSVMAVEAWHWLCQYVMQEGWYQTVFNKPGMTTDAAGSIPARVSPGGAVVVPLEAGKP